MRILPAPKTSLGRVLKWAQFKRAEGTALMPQEGAGPIGYKWFWSQRRKYVKNPTRESSVSCVRVTETMQGLRGVEGGCPTTYKKGKCFIAIVANCL